MSILDRLPALVGSLAQVERATRYRLSFVRMVEAWTERFLSDDDPEYEKQTPEFVAALKNESVRRLSEPEFLNAQYWANRHYRWDHARQIQRMEDEQFLDQVEEAAALVEEGKSKEFR